MGGASLLIGRGPAKFHSADDLAVVPLDPRPMCWTIPFHFESA